MTKSLVPSRTLPPINVDHAIAEWNDYQRLCREILDDNDYAEIRGIKARKRSGWAKLRRFYGISTRIIEEIRVPPLAEWEPGHSFMYKFTVAGWLGQRVEHGDGACEVSEMECPHCNGQGCERCKMTGYSIAPTEHNVRAKALTRAKNRVTSDLIGGGEVSAEELDSGSAAPAKRSGNEATGVRAVQEEANAQLEAMGLEAHYKSRPHTIKAIQECEHKATVPYLRQHFAKVVADLVKRVKEKQNAKAEDAPKSAEEAIEEARAAIDEQLEEMEGEKPSDEPEIITEEGNLLERLMEDANHNLKKRGYKGRYETADEVRQTLEAGGVSGMLDPDKYLDYLMIVLNAKEEAK